MKRRALAVTAGITLAAAVGIGVAAAATGPGPVDRIGSVLSGLVTDGTLTQQQADAVAEALGDARSEARAEREQRWQDRQQEVDALLKDTLGMTRDEVLAAVREGRTLKEIAGDKADKLAAGAVDLVEEHAAEAVADGRLTQEQADRMVAGARERADAWLAGDDLEMGPGLGLGMLLGRGMGGGGMGMGHAGPGFGPYGPGWGSNDDSGATSAPTA
jgi:polyhydroxyalkanoate synthesis regulator phasin